MAGIFVAVPSSATFHDPDHLIMAVTAPKHVLGLLAVRDRPISSISLSTISHFRPNPDKNWRIWLSIGAFAIA
jgi:hypothetical protein